MTLSGISNRRWRRLIEIEALAILPRFLRPTRNFLRSQPELNFADVKYAG